MKHTIMKHLTTRILLAACLLGSAASRLSAEEPASPDPYANETPAQRDARMQWWREAKFGMFIHWGVYAVPAGTYDGKQIGGAGEWIMHQGQIPCARYQQYAKQFNPVKYDPDAWVRLAKEAGMKYIVITSKHHDGFGLFDSAATDWDVVDATPYKKDLLKPLAEACRKHGIKLGFYYSQCQDWNHKGGSGNGWDQTQHGDMDAYVRDIAVPQVREILTKYGADTPAVLWWDTPWSMNRQRAAALIELLKLKPGIIHNNRLGGDFKGDTETPEQEIPATGFKGRDWETCMTMNDSWGFKSYDNNWKSTESIIRMLVDIASKGGNYLLNVGPTAEGEIPQPSIERLQQVGTWMKANGEAIYGTHASPFKKLSFNGRCTQKPGKLFLHLFARPAGGTITLPMANKITKAYLLADPNTALQVADKTITLPDALPDPIATVVVAEIQGAPDVGDGAIGQAADGSVTLRAADADITGAARLVDQGGTPNIGFWMDTSDTVQWPVNITRPGSFNVELTLACNPGSENSEYEIIAGEAKLTGKVAATKDWNDYTTVKVGTLRISKAGKLTLIIKPLSKPGQGVMNLRQVKLVPRDRMKTNERKKIPKRRITG